MLTGNERARTVAQETLNDVRRLMHTNYGDAPGRGTRSVSFEPRISS